LYLTGILSPPPEVIKKILLIRFSALGDILHTTPILPALRKKYPDTQLWYLLDSRFTELLENNPFIDGIIPLDRLLMKRRIVGAVDKIVDLLREIRSHSFDLVIDLQGFNETAILGFLSGSVYRLGKIRRSARYFYNLYERSNGINSKHPYDQYQNLLKPLGIQMNDPGLHLYLTDEDRSFAVNFFNKNGIKEKDQIIVFNLGGSHEKKRWATSKWANLGDRVCKLFDGIIILGSGPTERHLAHEVRNEMQNPGRTVILQTSIHKYAAVMEKTSLLISTDSGPLHVGTAMNIPTVALMVDKTRGNFRSLSTPQKTISRIRMRDLTTEDVMEHLEDFFLHWINKPLTA